MTPNPVITSAVTGAVCGTHASIGDAIISVGNVFGFILAACAFLYFLYRMSR